MKTIARVHINIDTGMERIGVHYYSAESLLTTSLKCQHVQVEGIFSHFANADAPDMQHSRLQVERFQEVLSFYERLSLPTPMRHMANSAAILQLPESIFDLVRPGILLYGVYPGLFHAVEYKPPAETVDADFPFWLTTGRVHVHYHTGTMTRNSPSLHAEMPEGHLEIHPEDARRLTVRQGDKVRVISRRGEITAKVSLTTRVEQGVVFMPFHFTECCANLLTNPAHDPIAKIPEYKVCAVQIEKAA